MKSDVIVQHDGEAVWSRFQDGDLAGGVSRRDEKLLRAVVDALNEALYQAKAQLALMIET
jgi:hypothetical protein